MGSDTLRETLAALVAPTPANDLANPAAGQLWRAAWGDVALLVVLVSIGEQHVDVVAAAADPVGDNTAITAHTTQGLAPVVWTSLAASLRTCVLDVRVADLEAVDYERVLATRQSGNGGDWSPILSESDDRTQIRLRLQDRLEQLSAAEWLTDADDGAPTLAKLAEERGLTTSDIAAALSISPGAARRLLKQETSPTAEQLDLLRQLLGEQPTAHIELPIELAAVLDLPRYRPRIRRWATRHGDMPEAAARRGFAGELMATAARHREPGQRNWAALVDDYADED